MSKLSEVLGKSISKLRKSRDLTQEQLATAIGRSRLTVQRIESGEAGLSTPETLAAIAKFFGVEEIELITGARPNLEYGSGFSQAQRRLSQIVVDAHAAIEALDYVRNVPDEILELLQYVGPEHWPQMKRTLLVYKQHAEGKLLNQDKPTDKKKNSTS